MRHLCPKFHLERASSAIKDNRAFELWSAVCVRVRQTMPRDEQIVGSANPNHFQPKHDRDCCDRVHSIDASISSALATRFLWDSFIASKVALVKSSLLNTTTNQNRDHHHRNRNQGLPELVAARCGNFRRFHGAR